MSSSNYIDFLAKLKLSHAHPGGALLTEHLLQKLQLTSKDHVLDIGCGTGATAALIRQRYESQVTAVDLHSEMVKAAIERASAMDSPYTVIQADAEHLPFADETFDILLSESVSAFTWLSRSLCETRRVLKKGGKWLGIEMTTNHKCREETVQQIKQFYGVKAVLTEDEWVDSLKRAGFTQIIVISDLDAAAFHFNEAPIIPVEKMDPEDFRTWWTHVSLMDQWKELLTYRIYEAKK